MRLNNIVVEFPTEDTSISQHEREPPFSRYFVTSFQGVSHYQPVKILDETLGKMLAQTPNELWTPDCALMVLRRGRNTR